MRLVNPLLNVTTAAILTLCLFVGACSERGNREDFTTLVQGKSESEALKSVGKPTAVDDNSADRHVWTYTDRTFDVNNKNKFDAKSLVIFTRSPEGKLVATEVKFE